MRYGRIIPLLVILACAAYVAHLSLSEWRAPHAEQRQGLLSASVQEMQPQHPKLDVTYVPTPQEVVDELSAVSYKHYAPHGAK